VVDCFDALTSDRPYRRAVTDEEAFAILIDRRGTKYDPVVVDTFIRVQRQLAPPAQIPVKHEDALARIARAAAPLTAPASPGFAQEAAATDSDNLLSLISLARLASDQASPADVASLTGTLIRNLVPGATCAIYLRNEEDLLLAHATGPLAPALRGITMPVNQRLSGWVAAHRRTIVNSDAALDLAGLDLPPSPRTCLSTPLLDGDTLVGVLTLYADGSVGFTDGQGRMMQMLGPHLALLARRMTVAVSTPAPDAAPVQPRSVEGGRLRMVVNR
jgi:hypothetical protein